MDSWLGFWAFTAMAQVQSLVGKVRSHKLRRVAKNKQTKKVKKRSFKTFKTQTIHFVALVGGLNELMLVDYLQQCLVPRKPPLNMG